jgi:flavin-binding protein dodecin
VHSGVDGDTPDIIDEEGTTANITDGMERAALSVHTVHQWLTFLQMPVVNAAAQQYKQQITIRIHKVELGIISKFWK